MKCLKISEGNQKPQIEKGQTIQWRLNKEGKLKNIDNSVLNDNTFLFYYGYSIM